MNEMCRRSSWPPSVVVAMLACVPLMLNAASCPPTPVVDRPAADLDVKITVLDNDDSPSDGKVPVFVQFFLDGDFVKLSNATVRCNGVVLSDRGFLGFGERVPMVPPGGQYVVRHTRGGVNTLAPVVAPSRPILTSPASGASVTRSPSLTITYVPGSGSSVQAWASDGSTGKGGNEQPDTGTYTGFDVSTLSAGPGRVSLTRDFDFNLPGTGFKSVTVKYTSGGPDVNVTWL